MYKSNITALIKDFTLPETNTDYTIDDDLDPSLKYFLTSIENSINDCLDLDLTILEASILPEVIPSNREYKPIPKEVKDRDGNPLENPTMIFICLSETMMRPLAVRKPGRSPRCLKYLKLGDLVVVNGITPEIQWRINTRGLSSDRSEESGTLLVIKATHAPTDINTSEAPRASGSEAEKSDSVPDTQSEAESDAIETPAISELGLLSQPKLDIKHNNPAIFLTEPPVELLLNNYTSEDHRDTIMAKYPGKTISPVLPPTATLGTTLCDATVIHKTEETMIDIRAEMRELKEAVCRLSLLIPCPSCTSKEAKPAPEAKLDTSKLEELESRLKLDLQHTEGKIAELISQANSMQELMSNSSREWKTFLDSAFFREDSELLKEIHKSVTAIEKSTAEIRPMAWGSDAGKQQNPSQSTQNRRPTQFVPFRSRRPAPRRPAPHQTGRATSNPGTTGTTKTTALISDSLLGSSRPNTIGKGHQCHVIRRRSWRTISQEKRAETLDQLIQLQPESIYIHLGVNDVYTWNNQEPENSPTEVANMAGEFIRELKTTLPNTQVTLSLPVLTADRTANRRIIDLKIKLRELCRTNGIGYDNNKNFGYLHLSTDGLHPTKTGVDLLRANLRRNILRTPQQKEEVNHNSEPPAQTDPATNQPADNQSSN